MKIKHLNGAYFRAIINNKIENNYGNVRSLHADR